MASTYTVNLVIYTGTDFQQVFILGNDDESPLVLNGYTVTSKMKKHGSSSTSYSFTTAITVAEYGRIRISMSDGETAQLKPGRYYYDILLTNPSGLKTRVIEGEVIVKKSVTR